MTYISHIFNSLSDISFQTEILELCGWDENIAEDILKKLSCYLKDDENKNITSVNSINSFLEEEFDEMICIAIKKYIKSWIDKKRYLEVTYEA